jgi:hypothetical protein
LIANVATVGFDELYRLIRMAPVEKRSQWIQQLQDMPPGLRREAALTSFYKTFVQIDPVAAAASINLLRDMGDKVSAASSMVGAAPEYSMGVMTQMLVQLPREKVDRRARDYLQETLEEWSMVDPAAVGRFIEEHPADDLRHYDWTLVYNWAQVDPQSALSWLERQSPVGGAIAAYDSLVEGWVQNDRSAAQAYVVAHATEAKMGRSVEQVTGETFRVSPGEAAGFVAQLPSDEIKAQALKAVAEMTRHSEHGTHEWERPPAVVANWLLTFQQKCWEDAMVTAVNNWKDQDAVAMTNWIDQLPNATRDKVISKVCPHFGSEDWNTAVPLAMKISTPQLREEVIKSFLEQWIPSEERLEERIQGIPLTSEERSYVAALATQIKQTSLH